MVNKAKKHILLTFLASLSNLFLFQIAKAADGVNVGLCPSGEATCSTYNYATYVSDFYVYAQRLGFTLAVAVVIYAGILYMTSQGDTTKINSAKEYFLGAILGYLILLLIGIILEYIGSPNYT